VRFVTGNLKSDRVDLPWEQLVTEQETLVFYMGLQSLETICSQLVAHGRKPDTPVAVIEQGTTRNQRTLTATLASLPGKIKDSMVHAPTLMIVGEVVTLRDKLEWFGESQNPSPWPPAAGSDDHPVGWTADTREAAGLD
jgi:uroporphyrin-III C-methyltransferase/precorrin-2 dehydrogenase/sirohydrochlorin ferrochelatase